MALAATGLTTHILNNNLKSGFLLASFPLLIFIMVFAFQLALYYFGVFTPHMAPPITAGAPIDAEMVNGAWRGMVCHCMVFPCAYDPRGQRCGPRHTQRIS